MVERMTNRQGGRRLWSREESFEVEEVEFDPTRRGYTSIPNYFKHFWTPLIGLKAAAVYEMLCSFAHGRKDECYPSVGLLADTLGVDKHDLTGRMRRDRRPGRRAEYYQKGMFEVLAEYGLAKATVEERNGTMHYRFKVLKSPPLLTPEQLILLPERLQRRHRQLLERCQREREEFAQIPAGPARPNASGQSAEKPTAIATGGGDAATGGGDAATLDLNITHPTTQVEQLSLSSEEREQVKEFYRKIGQPRVSRQKLEAGIKVLTDLKEQGFSADDITFGTGWILSHRERFGGEIHSLKLLPEVIGQALQEREKIRKSEEKKNRQDAEEQRFEAERARRQALEVLRQSLPPTERAALHEVAVERLLQKGIKRAFLVEPLVRGEVYRLLGERRSIAGPTDRGGVRCAGGIANGEKADSGCTAVGVYHRVTGLFGGHGRQWP